MKCIKCKKIIPSTSTSCPFCGTKVEKQEDIEVLDNNTIEFGNLSNTTFDNNLDLNIGEKKQNTKEEKTKKKVVWIALGVIFALFIVFIIIVNLFIGPNEVNYKVYTGIVKSVVEYTSETFTSSSALSKGDYKLVYVLDNVENEFLGEYELDVSRRILNLTGTMKNPGEDRGELIISNKPFEFTLNQKYNEFYLTSSYLYDGTILFPYEEEDYRLLSTKNYDLDSLVNSIGEATAAGLKAVSYNVSKNTEINFNGVDMKVTKSTLLLNNEQKKKFFTTFYETLTDDYNFTLEFSNITGRSTDDVVTLLESYKTTSDYKYSVDSEYYTNIDVYYKDSKVYRIDVQFNEEERKEEYILDIGETKYYLTHNKDGNRDYYITLSKIDSTMNDIVTTDYIFTYEGEHNLTGTLELEKENDPTIKSATIENYKSIRDFTDEEVMTLKSNVNVYLDNVSFIDNIREFFSTKCSKDLRCSCEKNKENCSCTYKTKIITCPSDVVN